jgi:DNA-directed RNA polymerase specialized sigma24 family protein
MLSVPKGWAAYARLQAKLSATATTDSRTWGLEAGLDRFLDLAGREIPRDADIDRAVQSESRRERYRARLRSIRCAADIPSVPEDAVEARRSLRALRDATTPNDWALLLAVADGCDYGEVAASLGVTAGQLRVRVMRLRLALPNALAA